MREQQGRGLASGVAYCQNGQLACLPCCAETEDWIGPALPAVQFPSTAQDLNSGSPHGLTHVCPILGARGVSPVALARLAVDEPHLAPDAQARPAGGAPGARCIRGIRQQLCLP